MAYTTDKPSARMLAALLAAYGVSRVVVSPGSRNAPLLTALAGADKFSIDVVTDERCAAFRALGIAQTTRKPVALVCTSGTAMLNYAPALAEAYYQALPLIAITADRPAAWIDQDDSQTIRQPGALTNVVKANYDIADYKEDDREADWYANRQINDALTTATTGLPGPVHINMQMTEPLNQIVEDKDFVPRVIETVFPEGQLAMSEVKRFASELKDKRVMIVCGFMPPDNKVNRALSRLAALQNVVLLTETVANIHTPHKVWNIDATLSSLGKDALAAMAPDVVITLGGALISRQIKTYLRGLASVEHWHVGLTRTTSDPLKRLTRRIMVRPDRFLGMFASALERMPSQSDYSAMWQSASAKAKTQTDSYAQTTDWSDMKAFSVMADAIPTQCNVQISNGTAIRYAQLFFNNSFHACHCNRGVSGIDGSTSTAVGAASVYNGLTLLITGDMSMTYDIGSLFNMPVPDTLRIIVMCNGGGGIFRFIGSTSAHPDRERLFCTDIDTDFETVAKAAGISVQTATDEASLRRELPLLFKPSGRARMLVVVTPPQLSADILKNYFKSL